ncbi:mitochondrial exonuclease V [Scheffersomyces xylosifermentans]|uniref:mitochondrial exonuclease V n=1 Tax=Scheffersomyces xylosifermentans TaxID=1304137 RepID=UPI00315C5EB9
MKVSMRNFQNVLRGQGKVLPEMSTGSQSLIPPIVPPKDVSNTTNDHERRRKLKKIMDDEDMEARLILKKFTIGREKETVLDIAEADNTNIGKDSSGIEQGIQLLPNDSLYQIYANWNLTENEMLPLYNPRNLNPYQFHSRFNSDVSYTVSPRLSVTKLLTDRWCELREYYTIYAGSPQYKATNAIKLGLERHSELEQELHRPVDTSILIGTLATCVSEAIARFEQSIKDIDDPVLLEKLSIQFEKFWKIAYGSPDVAKLSLDWSEQIIERLFTLITTSEAREVLVHGYVNLHNGAFVSKSEDLQRNDNTTSDIDSQRVLVSGVVDYFKLSNKNDISDVSLIEDIRDHLDYHFKDFIGNKQMIVLTDFLKDIVILINDHTSDFSVKTTDVKTRSWNRIPDSISVLNAAKFQTFYYRKMLGLLANESHDKDNKYFAYYSLLENARQRGLDVDEPVDVITIISILRKNYHLFYNDFVKLANGDKIDFEPFDKFMSQRTSIDYDVSSIIGITEQTLTDDFSSDEVPMHSHMIDKINEIEDFNYYEILTPKLIKKWTIAPTLRYFAARSAQFYGLFESLLGDSTAVEYHNGKTSQNFHTSLYNYDVEELDRHNSRASTFWNGSRFPTYTNDLNKCNYCDFKSKCLVPNHGLSGDLDKQSLGARLSEFMHLN